MKWTDHGQSNTLVNSFAITATYAFPTGRHCSPNTYQASRFPVTRLLAVAARAAFIRVLVPTISTHTCFISIWQFKYACVFVTTTWYDEI
ncbi:hypothetical protein M378DRAFT_172945 [Amanita muscaria Koide BX008]|uniref:Uncharacterized protein n=1 Tax=Amanita muscaria (strain Koide BX008) TaxID=946122 RepID=A0A0C2WJ61_AMAMK|nr:hypothetical protein M378DRAFT_172945 [Amanita muscaria Koide BX008]